MSPLDTTDRRLRDAALRIRSATGVLLTCEGCGREWRSYTLRGARPAQCGLCNASQYRGVVEEVLRADLAEARARIELLEAILGDEAITADFEGTKIEVARAWVALAQARGWRQTRDRCIELEAAAKAWARVLAISPSGAATAERQLAAVKDLAA